MGDELDRDASVEALMEALIPGLANRLRGPVDEIEIAQSGWRVRVRRRGPAVDAGTGPAGAAATGSTNGAGAVHASSRHQQSPPPQPARVASAHGAGQARAGTPSGRIVATAPAVGVFMPRGDVGLGAHVRAGDRLGIVDLLGVPQDVVAPVDGVLAASLVEPGEGVEYGQELLVIEAR